MKTYVEMELQIHAFLTLILDAVKWPASRLGHFIPGEKHKYSLDRRMVGSQSRSGRGGEEKNSQSLSGLEPPISQPNWKIISYLAFCLFLILDLRLVAYIIIRAFSASF